MTAQASGLRGAVVGESEISDVQPEGNLYYRGYNIHDLADHATFEEVVYLLWKGDLPNKGELDRFRSELAVNYALPDEVMALLRGFPKKAAAMDALRTGMSALSMADPDAGDNSEPDEVLRRGLRALPLSGRDRCAAGRDGRSGRPPRAAGGKRRPV